jgi:hypothetical protein
LDGGLVSPLLGQPGFLDPDDRDHRFSETVDPLLMRASLTEFEAFRPKLARDSGRRIVRRLALA